MSWNGFKLIKGEVEKTAEDLGILMTDGSSNPITAATLDRTVSIPGMNGVHYFGSDLRERRITIPCAFVYADNLEALETAAYELEEFLLDENNKPAKLELIFEATPTKGYYVYYSGMIDMRRTVFDGQFDLPLLAPNPIAHTVTP